MEDTEWAIRLSTKDTAPDELLDAVKAAREIGRDQYSEQVIGATAGILVESVDFTPLINAMLVGSQAFGKMMAQMNNGPVTITIEVDYASTE